VVYHANAWRWKRCRVPLRSSPGLGPHPQPEVRGERAGFGPPSSEPTELVDFSRQLDKLRSRSREELNPARSHGFWLGVRPQPEANFQGTLHASHATLLA